MSDSGPSRRGTAAARAAAAASLLLGVGIGAQQVGGYRPARQVSGVIRLWGHGSPTTPFMAKLVEAWEEGFRRRQPAVRFENRLYGTASAIGALYTGTGDVAILGREILVPEVAAFQRVKGYAPTGVDIATGSLDVRNFDFALAVFVHKDNPVRSLTLAQLDAIFDCEPRRARAPARTWGVVGAAGEWANHPIRLYGSRLNGGFAIFFQTVVMNGGSRWNPGLKEFFDVRRQDNSLLDSGQQVVDAVGQDRDGIGIASLLYKSPDVKPLALAFDDRHEAVPPTRQTLIDRSYPLTRVIPAFFDRKPDTAVEPVVREFLRYLLSADGQQAIVDDGRYLPLGADAVARALRKLE